MTGQPLIEKTEISSVEKLRRNIPVWTGGVWKIHIR